MITWLDSEAPNLAAVACSKSAAKVPNPGSAYDWFAENPALLSKSRSSEVPPGVGEESNSKS